MRVRIACIAAVSITAIGCDFFGEGEGGERGSGKRIHSSLTWMSTSLARPDALGKIGAGTVTPARTLVSSDSGDDLYLSYLLTPSNIEGRLIQASLMVGEPGEGRGGTALRLAGPSESGFMDKAVGQSGDLPQFNLAERLTMGDGFSCCWESYPSADNAKSGWFELMFAYVDVTFPVDSGALAGSHTVRVAFADVGDKGYRKGDLLYKSADGFHWVDSSTGTPAVVRPATPLRLGWVAEYKGSGDGRGNQHIPTLFVAVEDSQKVHMPADTVLANSWEFIVDFILTDGLIFRRMDPSAMATVSQLLSHFDIRADRDNASSGSQGISSNFYAIKTPLDKPRPNDFKDSLDQWIQPPAADSLDK